MGAAQLAHLVAALAVTACGAHPTTPLQADNPGGWASYDFEQRHERMTLYVLPSMARQFRRHRGEPFATLTCLSCHGENAEAVDYRMPNGLYPLNPEALPNTDEARWMAETVVPAYDRVAQAGGSTTCFSCHERATP